MAPPPRHSRPRIAILNDYEVVVRGVAAMLGGYSDRVEVVELDNRMPVVSDVDLVLFDSFGVVSGDGLGLADLVRAGGPRVVVFAWTADPGFVEAALAQGAAGYLSKTLRPAELVDALERVHRGDVVVRTGHEPGPGEDAGDWPGHPCGLSPREAEVMALITKGLSNKDIAQTIFLSVNSVKTHIRAAYRKTGVCSRSQAVLWALEHGFSPEPGRTVNPDPGRHGG